MLSVVLLAYSVARAALVGFAHDESHTFLHAVDQPIGRVLALSFRDANNHPLNTWGMYLSERIFGPAELALRLPNLLSHSLYLASAMLFAGGLRSRTAGWGTFLALTLNPFQLELFSLARGYGIGLGFVMASLWLGGRCLNDPDESRALGYGAGAIVCSTFSVFSNYAYVYFYVAFVLSLLVSRRILAKVRVDRNVGPLTHDAADMLLGRFLVWNTVLSGLAVGPNIVELQGSGAFYVGGETGLWEDTIRSLIAASVPGLPTWTIAAEWAVALIVAAGGVLLLRAWVARKRDEAEGGLLLGALAFYLCLAGIWGSSRIFGLRYVEGRSALFLLPLFAVVVGHGLAYLGESSRRGLRVATVAVVLLAIGEAANLASAANVHSTTVWPYDANTKGMLEDLREDVVTRDLEPPVRLGIDWWFEPTVNFYRVTTRLDWLDAVTRDGLGARYDYYYYESGSRGQIVACEIEVLRTYPWTGNQLARCRP